MTNTHSSGSSLATSSSLTVSLFLYLLTLNVLLFFCCFFWFKAETFRKTWFTLQRHPCVNLRHSLWFSPHKPSPLLLHQINEESSSSGNLHAYSSSSSSQAVNPSSSVPLAVSSSATNGLHPSGAPGLTPNGTNTTLSAAGGRTAPLLNTSGRPIGLHERDATVTCS